MTENTETRVRLVLFKVANTFCSGHSGSNILHLSPTGFSRSQYPGKVPDDKSGNKKLAQKLPGKNGKNWQKCKK